MQVVNSIGDLRDRARRRIPRALYDYIDRGSYDEVTWNRNRDDFRALALRQRVMVDVSRLSVGTTVLGEHWKLPVGLAPTGLTGFFHRDGEILAARAAQAAGVPFTLSTMSICSIEDVRAAVEGTFWFQLYLMRDRGFNEALIARAREARCSALMLTLDLPLQALRRRDPKNGLSVPPRLTPANAWEILMRPRWLAGVLLGKRHTLGNLAAFFPKDGIATLSEWVGGQFDSSITWKDVAWVRERWPGKLILKGIMDPEDARLAQTTGVDAIVVSNHGGRQLDGATSTIAALPRVVEAVAGRCEVLLDGGVTSGQDVLKALALGARACLIGKAYLYGLAALGGAGVSLALAIMRRELEVSMALTGLNDVRRIDSRILVT
ncbi:MAG TPA: alpha-hydroxy acid oxidase [Steroidobacteraceae bacterium]|jgi:L-lactate dehydrogenase (cytochrome)|nr:alpha-hydroxy acid oxidase [Steroidobacteraceae bacterium]